MSAAKMLTCLLLTGAAACGHTTESRMILRVDSNVDTATTDRAGFGALDDPSNYRAQSPRDRYEIVVNGDRVTVTRLELDDPNMKKTLSGKRLSASSQVALRPGDVAYELDGDFAGAELVIRSGETQGEITFFGSGRPVISSERGSFVRR